MPGDPLDRLRGLSQSSTDPWEISLVDIALRALRDGGIGAVRGIEEALAERASGKPSADRLRVLIGEKLSLRDASDFLAVLESGEADRLDRSREVIQKVLAVAASVADDLLKVALGGSR